MSTQAPLASGELQVIRRFNFKDDSSGASNGPNLVPIPHDSTA
jgi:hypothetical protein